tara:strand:+ start:619 stop:810 length:192 start_codon:yes stop_codon:yes gene_type:complete
MDNNLPDLDLIDISELLMIVGSYIYAGNSIETVESEIVNKLLELLNEEKNKRFTPDPKHGIIH